MGCQISVYFWFIVWNGSALYFLNTLTFLVDVTDWLFVFLLYFCHCIYASGKPRVCFSWHPVELEAVPVQVCDNTCWEFWDIWPRDCSPRMCVISSMWPESTDNVKPRNMIKNKIGSIQVDDTTSSELVKLQGEAIGCTRRVYLTWFVYYTHSCRISFCQFWYSPSVARVTWRWLKSVFP